MNGMRRALGTLALCALVLCQTHAWASTQYGTQSAPPVSGRVTAKGRETLAGVEGAFYYTSLYTVTGYEGDDERVWVPEYINGNEVEAIGEGAFAGNTTIRQLHLPLNKSVSIGNGAMRGMTALETVNIPNNVTQIGENVLADCGPQLEEIYFVGPFVMSIGEGSFLGNPNVTLVGGGMVVREYAKAHGIAWIEEPELALESDTRAEVRPDGTLCLFGRATNAMSTFDIVPQNVDGVPVTAIGSRAYYCWSKLRSIYIPKSVTEIAEDAFEGIKDLTIHTENGSAAAEFARNHGYQLDEDAQPALDGLVYEISPLWWRVEITGYTGTQELLTVPETIMSVPVESIGPGAFSGNRTLREVTLPATVVRVSGSAFRDCINLERVDMQGAFGSDAWGANTFRGCEKLVQVTIAQGTQEIPENAFFGCASLTSVNVPTSVRRIEGGAFAGCVSLTALTFEEPNAWVVEDGLGYRGDWLEFTMPELMPERVVVREGTTTIRNYAFNSCNGMTELVIPGSVARVERFMTSCRNLKTIELGEGVQLFDEFNTGNVERIILPASVQKIGTLRLSEERGLVVAPEGSYAYQYALEKGLRVVDPSTLDTLEGAVSTEGLLYAPVGEGRIAITGYEGPGGEILIPAEIDGLAVVEIATEAFKGHKEITGVLVSSGVERIGASAFAQCSEMQYIELPDTLTEMGDELFDWCSGLTELIIPDGVAKIPMNAFVMCYGMRRVVLPASLEEIDFGAFQLCKELEVIIPAGLQRLNGGAFFNCDVHLTFEEGSPLMEEDGIIYDTGKTTIFCYLPSASRADIVIPDGIVAIADKAFSSNDLIETVVVPGSVKQIGEYAFRWADNLREVRLMEGVEEVKNGAFDQIAGLELLVLPQSLVKLSLAHNGYSLAPDNLTVVAPEGSYAEKAAIEEGYDVLHEDPNPPPKR